MRLTHVAVLLCVAAPSAHAATIKFCFKADATYTDNSYGLADNTPQDYWVNDSAERIRGAKFSITGTGLSASGWLDDGLGADGAGCTPTLTVSNANQTYTWRVYAWTTVQGNEIEGLRNDNSTHCYRELTYAVSNGGGTHEITITGSSSECAQVFRAVNSASWAMYRHAWGMTGKTYVMKVGSGCNNTTSGQTSCITNGDFKFRNVHELGHAIASARDADFGRSGTCDFESTSCPGDPGQSESISHSMGSKERQPCAFKEALSHFYAADAWNAHTANADCVWRYIKPYDNDTNLGFPTIDCEAGSNASNLGVLPDVGPDAGIVYEVPYMSTQCSASYAEKGVEVDWLRAFWDVHTNGGTVSFNDMIDWMDQAIYWGTSDDYFGALDSAANSIGGQLDTTWDGVVTQYGLDP